MTSGPADRARWAARYVDRGEGRRPPSAWVLETVAGLPEAWTVTDIAGGDGRHAVPLAEAGRHVVVVDFVERAVRAAVAAAPGALGIVADVTALPLAPGSVDIALCTNFLDRSIFPHLASLLRPGGCLVYETYLTPHMRLVAAGKARGPSSPRFLLAPGELPRLVAPLVVVSAREGVVRDAAGVRCCASILARREALA